MRTTGREEKGEGAAEKRGMYGTREGGGLMEGKEKGREIWRRERKNLVMKERHNKIK